jgi:hypothetical protein
VLTGLADAGFPSDNTGGVDTRKTGLRVVDYQSEGNRSFVSSPSAELSAFAGNVVDELKDRIKKGPDVGAFLFQINLDL